MEDVVVFKLANLSLDKQELEYVFFYKDINEIVGKKKKRSNTINTINIALCLQHF